MTLNPQRQSARMSKITNDGLTRSGTGCLIVVTIWQQSASKSSKHRTAHPRQACLVTDVCDWHIQC